jgi:hypothetical protein
VADAADVPSDAFLQAAVSATAAAAGGDAAAAEALAPAAASFDRLLARLVSIANPPPPAGEPPPPQPPPPPPPPSTEVVAACARVLVGLSLGLHAKAPHVLTRVHVEALRAAARLGGRGHALAAPLLRVPQYYAGATAATGGGGALRGADTRHVPSAPPPPGAVPPSLGVSPTDVAVFHYLAGVLTASTRDWRGAAELLATVRRRGHAAAVWPRSQRSST